MEKNISLLNALFFRVDILHIIFFNERFWNIGVGGIGGNRNREIGALCRMRLNENLFFLLWNIWLQNFPCWVFLCFNTSLHVLSGQFLTSLFNNIEFLTSDFVLTFLLKVVFSLDFFWLDNFWRIKVLYCSLFTKKNKI